MPTPVALTVAIALVLLGGRLSAGELAPQSVPSAALGKDLAAMVYTPDGAPPAGGWPALYLLHGHDGNERSWAQLGQIRDTLDAMIGAGEIAPLVAVMPDAGNSWYVDSADVGGPGDYETAIVEDLATWIEANCPVRRDRAGRAIVGLSMGGFGALRLALAHPDRYAAAASLSGALWQNVPAEDFDLPPEQIQLIADARYFHRVDPDTVDTLPVVPNLISHFSGAFGAPFDARRFNRQNVFTLLERGIEADADLPALYVTVGDDDSYQLWRGALALFETARADDRDLELRVTDGDHRWSLWSVSIRDALRFVDARAFGPQAAP